MWIYKLLLIVAFGAVTHWASADEQSSEHECNLKERGIFLYNMQRFDEAWPYLEGAAQEGDRDAQYFLGQIRARKDKYISEAALRWYKAAAAQKHVNAIVMLSYYLHDSCRGRTDCYYVVEGLNGWREEALNITNLKANDGDGKSMYDMYLLTDDFDWLIKSAHTGFAPGQHDLGRKYRNGESFFLTPARRMRAAEKWNLAAAESDYVPAIRDLISHFSEAKDFPKILFWTKRAVELGDFGSTANYVSWLSDPPASLANPQDLIQAYGYTVLLDEAESDALKESNYREYLTLDEIASKMSPDQIEEGKLFAQKWKVNRRPLAKYSKW